MNNIITAMKNFLERINRITEVEEWINDLEDSGRNTSTEQDKEKGMKRNKDSLRDPWENIQWTNIYIIGVLEGKVFPHGSDHNLRICLQCGRPGFDPWDGESPWKREQLPTPVFLPGESYGQRSLADCSPWGCRESDTTEQLTLSRL